jgi:type IV secretion system protein TrbJ
MAADGPCVFYHVTKAKISALLFSLALTTSMPTFAGIPVIDGTNLTQNIVAAIENTSQTLKQIQEYQTQLKQYQNIAISEYLLS